MKPTKKSKLQSVTFKPDIREWIISLVGESKRSFSSEVNYQLAVAKKKK